MAVIRYEWKCKLCGVHESVDVHYTNRFCYPCTAWMVRVYGFSYHRGFQEHFNPTVNKYVKSNTEFADELKKVDDYNWNVRGVETKMVPIDPYDTARTGATGEGLENTHRLARDSGQTEAKKLIL